MALKKKSFLSKQEYQRQWSLAHPGYKAQKTREWRLRNLDYHRARCHKWNMEHREKQKEAVNIWREEHRLKYNAYMAEYMKDYKKGIRRKDDKESATSNRQRSASGARSRDC